MKHINPRVYEHQEIEFCRITANGYGGQGITFVEASNRTGSYIPYMIKEVSGQVYNSVAKQRIVIKKMNRVSS